ncbi:MAG: replication protein RepA [Rhizobiales bacterium 63-22]|jgi:plasmid replication initiation protein|nr:MAG: replication protein RepA [Rhizobiales bacterium 63-22]
MKEREPRLIKDIVDDKVLARLDMDFRKRVEREARPGETWEQAALRLRDEDEQRDRKARAAGAGDDNLQASLRRLGESIKRNNARQGAGGQGGPSNLRKPPADDVQADFFVPALYDVGTRDNRSMMDVAVFRLSKDKKRAGEVIRYDLPDGYVEVKAGPDGMASVWDYDIVLMLVSHMTEAMNRHREGRGEKPGRVFRPHVSDILKFCRKGDGTRQFEEVEAALARLQGTIIKSVREVPRAGKRALREVESEGLISRHRVVSRTDTGKVASVEIEAPNWIYREVTEGKRPDVLTVHPDYFLIEPGIGRFVYRLARRAAGKSKAKWAFQTIYQRSGSTGTFKEFCRILRRIIAADDLPEYSLQEEAGQSGPQLVMQHRNATLNELSAEGGGV